MVYLWDHRFHLLLGTRVSSWPYFRKGSSNSYHHQCEFAISWPSHNFYHYDNISLHRFTCTCKYLLIPHSDLSIVVRSHLIPPRDHGTSPIAPPLWWSPSSKYILTQCGLSLFHWVLVIVIVLFVWDRLPKASPHAHLDMRFNTFYWSLLLMLLFLHSMTLLAWWSPHKFPFETSTIIVILLSWPIWEAPLCKHSENKSIIDVGFFTWFLILWYSSKQPLKKHYITQPQCDQRDYDLISPATWSNGVIFSS